MKHISDQQNGLIIALHNAWCRIVYAKRIGAARCDEAPPSFPAMDRGAQSALLVWRSQN